MFIANSVQVIIPQCRRKGKALSVDRWSRKAACHFEQNAVKSRNLGFKSEISQIAALGRHNMRDSFSSISEKACLTPKCKNQLPVNDKKQLYFDISCNFLYNN